MLLAELGLDEGPEQRLHRRRQLTQGIHWLLAAQGDPLAALLRGFGEDPGAIEARLRERGPGWHSRTGAWVVSGHPLTTRLLTGGGLRYHTPVGPSADSEGPGPAAEACPGELDGLGQHCDLARIARAAAIRALCSDDDPRERAMLADAEPALDAMVCPQPADSTRRLLAAVEQLRARHRNPLLAVAGVRVAAALSANALAAVLLSRRWGELAAEPDRASRVVAETLRHEPPIQLCLASATTALDLAAVPETVREGEPVVLALRAANRDPAAFHHPDRFDSDRPPPEAGRVLVPGGCLAPVLATARAQAEALLSGLASRYPGMRVAGPIIRASRAPVTRAITRLPVRTA